MNALRQMWLDNPVLVKELRARMRGTRAYWILVGYLLFLSFILFFQYTSWWNQVQGQGGLASSSKIGQDFFKAIAWVQAFLVAFITPAVTSGAITIEREQRTMEMLEMTRLSSTSIIAGKLFSAVSFVALLLISSLPLTSICFFLGGVSPEQVLYAYMLLLAGAFVAGTLGLAWSSIARTTSSAVLFTYSSFLLPVIVLFVYGKIITDEGVPRLGEQLIASCVLGVYGAPVPFPEFSPLSPFFTAWDQRHFYGLTLPVWIAPLLTFGLIGLTLAAVASSRLRPSPERKGALLKTLVVLLFVEQMFFYFGARFFPYSRAGSTGLGLILTGYPLLAMLSYPVFMLLLFVPLFTTGEMRTTDARRFGAYLLSGWLPSSWKRSKLSGGMPFVFLLALLIVGMYWLSFVFVGQPGAAKTGSIVVTGSATSTFSLPPRTPSGMPVLPMPPTGPVPTQAGGLPEFVVTLLASLIGLSALGFLYSVITRNRWTAAMLSYATLILIFVAPLIARGNYNFGSAGNTPSIFINLFYLNPLMSLSEMTDTTGTFWSSLPLMFGNTPIWQVTTVVYLFITAIALVLAIPFVTKIAARNVLPYET